MMMLIRKDKHGFESLLHMDLTGRMEPLVRESPIVTHMGYDCLYIGETHHLTKAQVRELIRYLQYWVEHNSLSKEADD